MLILISPAKNLDFESSLPPAAQELPTTTPQFKSQSRALAALMKVKSPQELVDLQSISTDLGHRNAMRWRRWNMARTTGKDARQALFAFRGAVYQGMKPEEFSNSDLEYAQDHLRILSGLYGVLRPLDIIRPYRLEMGTKLENQAGSNLYNLWQPLLTKKVRSELRGQSDKLIVNLASTEYASAVLFSAIKSNVVTPTFQDETRSGWRALMHFVKTARGAMASWIVQNRIEDVEQLKEFSGLAYEYVPSESSDGNIVFRRQAS